MRSEDEIEFTHLCHSNVETVVVLSPFVLSAWGNEIGHVIYSHALCFDRPAFDGHEFAFCGLENWWNSGIAVGSADWEGFGAQVSGEWDGYSAEFNFAGEPIQLPSNIVPDAFREWGVEIHDWQTQCPTLAHPENGHLWYKVIRLHPTVGCEADAATVYGVEICDVQEKASALAHHSSGSYTIVWRGKRVTREQLGSGPGKEVMREGDEIEVEQCLVHERKRIRVLQQLDPRRRVMMFREAWDGPFRNGESLGGCAIGTPAFATQKPLEASALTGSWRTDLYSAQNLQHQQV
jgi:hypothetical protein